MVKRVEIGLLGSLNVADDAGKRIEIAGNRIAMLLTALALRCGEVVSDDALIDAVWGAVPPQQPANALQRQVSRLRSALESPDVIERRGGGYALTIDRSAIDIFRFDALAAQGYDAARIGDPARARALLDQALGLWRGEPLVDVAYEEFAQQEIIRLAEARLDAIEARIDADLGLGRDKSLIAELEQLVAAHPLREHFRAQLMLALSRSGRQAEALRAYQEARDTLREQLGLEPSAELRRLERAILEQDDVITETNTDTRARPRTNLRTPLTSLIGRVSELHTLTDALNGNRLVTLVGPGGVGKSRLSQEVAHDRFAVGDVDVWMVELAAVSDGNAIVPAIMKAIDLPRGASDSDDLPLLVEYLRGRAALIILDNCEHLVTAAARVTQDLLESCPTLQILATSREGLAVAGEVLYAVPPLAIDDAVALFVERGQAANPASKVTEQSPQMQHTLADICGRLDGLPLAIELAAARLRAMPIVELASGLEDRFRVLTRGARTALPRQQTLRAVVDWSYDLLFEDERVVFNRLSVFRGSCSVAAARVVCADDEISGDDVSEMITRLVDKSLVVMETDEFDGYGRCHMLQTLVDYGRERLEESGDAASVYAAHVHYYADFAVRSIAALLGIRQRGWLRAVAANMTNLRAALDVAVDDNDAETAHTIAGSLGWFWCITTRGLEGSQWFARARTCSGDVSDLAQARMLAWRVFADAPGFVKWGEAGGAHQNSRERSSPYCLSHEEITELSRQAAALYAKVEGSEVELACVELALSITFSTIGDRQRTAELVADAERLLAAASDDPRTRAMRFFAIGRLAALEDRYVDADDAFRISVDLMSSNSISAYEALAMRYVARLASVRNDPARAIEALERACAIAQGLGLNGYLHLLLGELGDAISCSGDTARARVVLARPLAWSRELGFLRGIAEALTSLAIAEWRAGEPERAAECAQEGFDAARQIDHFEAAAYCEVILGWAATILSDARDGRSSQLDALDIAQKAAFPRAMAFALESLAATSLREHDGHAAARLLGAASALRRAPGAAIGLAFSVTTRVDVDALVSGARTELGAEEADAAFADGLHDPDGVIAELLQTST